MSEEEKKGPRARGCAALEAELAGFPAKSITVRVLDALLRALPGAPPLPAYASLAEAAVAVTPDVPPDVVARAEELADEPGIDRALFAARSIDTGDTGITILTGVRSALSLFLGSSGPGSGVDSQQRADAALKALALAYLTTALIPRPAEERVAILKALPAGQELLLYFGAVEVALPLRAEAAAAGDGFVAGLVEKQSRSIASKLLAVVGREGVAEAQETLEHLTRTLDDVVAFALPHTDALAQSLNAVLPTQLALGQTVQDVVAAGADALPSYRYLCARLAAESCLVLAKLEMMPLLDHPEIVDVPQPVSTPPPPALPEGLALAAAAASGLHPAVEAAGPPPSSGGDPFAPPAPAAPAAAGNPFAAAAAAPTDNPFAAPQAAPPVAVDPFAPPPPQEPADPFAPPPPPDAPPPPPSFVVPTEPLPPDKRLTGSFLHGRGPAGRWLVFTQTGLFSDHPPAQVPPVDWAAHAAENRVGVYDFDGSQVHIRFSDGTVRTGEVVRDTYTLTLDGVVADRCDFNLTGKTLEGTWQRRGGHERLVLGDDGIFEFDGAGTYALGVARIGLRWADGRSREAALLSSMRPTARSPATLWIDGVAWDRDPQR